MNLPGSFPLFRQGNNQFVKNLQDCDGWVGMLISEESKPSLGLGSKLVKEELALFV